MLSAILPLVHILVYSAYALNISYETITRLQKYEEQSEKAAEWSNTAAERLRKTRTTQGSGAISIATSVVTALTLLLPFVPIRSRKAHLALSGINTGTLLLSRFYMAQFWNDRNQVQVPFVQKFNEAIKQSERLVRILGVLSASWAIAGWTWWLHPSGVWGLALYGSLVAVITVLGGGF
ncbi:hypothetical protein K491DRAFT_720859 [Lophiostoma macrostomum CBS 122681]|uniref:DUF1772-domain-containing protein n=1 Tax=Lophiostoma macrostomum CBS 122681 TaxID=1314788 RepID=A0A6A6SVS3_9PLEO|nr:hypothetical protein K491DRAFT_720859 [Lophiostoma macrostomum CBS 122681]